MTCRMGQIHWAPVRHHLPLISHHLERNSLQFVRQDRHAPCERNLGPKFMWLASSATQWPSYDLLDVQHYHHQGPCHPARSPGEDATSRSGKGPPHHRTWHGHVERSDGLSRNSIPQGVVVIDMDCLALGQTGTHPSDRKVWNGRFWSAIKLDPPLYILGTDDGDEIWGSFH